MENLTIKQTSVLPLHNESENTIKQIDPNKNILNQPLKNTFENTFARQDNTNKDQLYCADKLSEQEYIKSLKKSLFKKATGFVVEETTKEFVKDEDKMVLSKKKVTTKEFPPDSSAIKFLLELEKFNNNEFENLTDEQLHQEKLRLLNILKDEEIDS